MDTTDQVHPVRTESKERPGLPWEYGREETGRIPGVHRPGPGREGPLLGPLGPPTGREVHDWTKEVRDPVGVRVAPKVRSRAGSPGGVGGGLVCGCYKGAAPGPLPETQTQRGVAEGRDRGVGD